MSTAIKTHLSALKRCRACSDMIPPVIVGTAVRSKVMLIGQAPGPREGDIGKPFAWTAGKTLFRWFSELGLEEEQFRAKVYIGAVCRCFPGKNPNGGDRVPSNDEIENCSKWMSHEFQLLKPDLVLPVGKLAIGQFLNFDKLTEVVGAKHNIEAFKQKFDIIPLPHPSGASTWHRTEPGKALLKKALQLVKRHPSFKKLVR